MSPLHMHSDPLEVEFLVFSSLKCNVQFYFLISIWQSHINSIEQIKRVSSMDTKII